MTEDANEPNTPDKQPGNEGAGKNKLLSALVSIMAGSAAGICLHYSLYLMTLPQKPFIYAWF